MSEERIEIDVRASERRIYDRLRAPLSRAEGFGPGDVLLLLPDLVVLLARLARDPRVPFRAKLIALAGVAYAVSPVELLPELLLGPLGLVDDVLVAVAALSRVINHVHPDLVAMHWSGKEDVLDAIRRVSLWAEDLLGKTVARALGFKRVS